MSRIISKVGFRLEKALKREPRLSHAEWAEKNVFFKGSDVSPFPGKLKLSKSPHLRKVFEVMDDPSKRRIALKWASQTAKTLALTIPTAKKLATDPSFVHWIFPVKDKVGDLITIKIDPMMKSIPKVWRQFEAFRSEEKLRDKKTFKPIAGGGLYITGVTPNDLKSISVPLTIADECGEMALGTLSEAEERQKSFSKVYPRTIAASTIVHEGDEICAFYDTCECQLEYHFICPECDKTFIDALERYESSGIIYPKTFFIATRQDYATHLDIDISDTKDQQYLRYIKDTSHLKCPHCTYEFKDDVRQKMLYNGKGMEWVAVSGELEGARSVGFAVTSLGAWVVPMEDVIEAVYKAGDSPERLDKLYRNWFNTFYRGDEEQATDASMLQMLDSECKGGIVPEDTVAIYQGVDTQKDHFWQITIAYRIGKNPHIISYKKIETFKELYELFEKDYFYDNGDVFVGGVRRLAIDTQGYYETEDAFNTRTGKEEKVITVNRPQEVKSWLYEFSEIAGQYEEQDRLIGTIGAEMLANDVLHQWVDTKVEIKEYRESRKIRLAKLSSIPLKLSVMSSINKSVMYANGEDIKNDKTGMLTFDNDIVGSYGGSSDKLHPFEQLTSENYGYHPDKNKKYKTFKRIKKDNHLLDCFYACEWMATLDRVDTIKTLPPRGEETTLSMRDLLM